jgi:hypothetical protein
MPDYFSALPEICPEIVAKTFAIGIDSTQLWEYWDSALAGYIFYFQWDWMQMCHQGN